MLHDQTEGRRNWPQVSTNSATLEVLEIEQIKGYFGESNSELEAKWRNKLQKELAAGAGATAGAGGGAQAVATAATAAPPLLVTEGEEQAAAHAAEGVEPAAMEMDAQDVDVAVDSVGEYDICMICKAVEPPSKQSSKKKRKRGDVCSAGDQGEVLWVRCDGDCGDRWFHCCCADFDPESTELYYCQSCT